MLTFLKALLFFVMVFSLTGCVNMCSRSEDPQEVRSAFEKEQLAKKEKERLDQRREEIEFREPLEEDLAGTVDVSSRMEYESSPSDVLTISVKKRREPNAIALAEIAVPEPVFPLNFVIGPSDGIRDRAFPDDDLMVVFHLSRSGEKNRLPGDIVGSARGFKKQEKNLNVVLDFLVP